MASVFLNYRREDSAGHAGRLFDRLAARFGKDQIFRDVDRIEPGLNFTQVIDDSLNSCVAVLVLIGPKWLELKNAEGRNRLHEPVDYVRLEIEQAIGRGVRVIPVLLPGVSTIPAADALPESIAEMSNLHAFPLTEDSWDSQINKLTMLLERLGLEPLPQPREPRFKKLISYGLMALGGLFVVGILANLMIDDEPPTPPWQSPPLTDDPPIAPPEPDKPPTLEPELPATASNVSAFQRALSALGHYQGVIDGISGPQTVTAIKRFQSDNGLAEDGRMTESLLSRAQQMAAQRAGRTQVQPDTPGNNIAGTWYDNYNNRYEISQQGSQVKASAYSPGGDFLGSFAGQLSGQQMVYRYNSTQYGPGSGVGILQPDNQHIDTVSEDQDSGETEINQLHRGHTPR